MKAEGDGPLLPFGGYRKLRSYKVAAAAFSGKGRLHREPARLADPRKALPDPAGCNLSHLRQTYGTTRSDQSDRSD